MNICGVSLNNYGRSMGYLWNIYGRSLEYHGPSIIPIIPCISTMYAIMPVIPIMYTNTPIMLL